MASFEERFRILRQVIEFRVEGSGFRRFAFSVHLAEFGGAPLSRSRLGTMEEIDRLLSTIELDEYTIKDTPETSESRGFVSSLRSGVSAAIMWCPEMQPLHPEPKLRA